MHTIRLLLMSLTLLAPPTGSALAAADARPHGATCHDRLQVPLPEADVGTAPAGCAAATLYYGSDGKGGDPVAARHCAYRERAGAGHTVSRETVFGGSGVLMMLYANGQGVPRDIALASRFACEYGGAPAEIRGRLQHLQWIADGTDTAPMDICDDITSGMMSGFCAHRDAGFARVARNRQWQALQSDWTPVQRDAWSALRGAADDYFGHVGSDEIDLSGTARGAFAAEARETLEIQLLADVQRFEHGDRPAQTAAALAPLDRQLNTVYREVRARLQAGASPHPYALSGTVNADGVRDTQRAWLRYRDAWVAFAATRWPDTEGDAWRAWLTETRTAALEAITGGP
ncbi:DUF1311 domain-containing protein [Luteimonas sp. XNQY3]|nr:lysozyme inhibitor LprI family protein [Luteimonas sp. XNQY3]MCD9006614.1 DUF1311 domain-containing protein [Luteimonas sp. XNQY3]